MTDLGLGDHLRRTAQRYPDRVFLQGGGDCVTYADFNRRTDRLGLMLRRRGVVSGDRVATFTPRTRQALELLMACWKIGAVCVPINTRLTFYEAVQQVHDTGAKVIFTEADWARGSALAEDGKVEIVAVDGEGPGTLDALLANIEDDTPQLSSAEHGATIIYSSGTTGHAKGIYSGQRQLVDHSLRTLIPEYALSSTSRILLLYPHTSAGTINIAFVPALILGATLIVDATRGFTAQRFLDNVQAHRVTHLTAVPTMLHRVAEHIEMHGLNHDVGSLERIAYGSAPMAPAVTARLLSIFGPILMQNYGMTEATGMVTCLRPEEHDPSSGYGRNVLASCGAAVADAELRLVDGSGAIVEGPNTVGEVEIRASGLMYGYWGDEQRTEQAFHDGWLRSGDIGRFDDRGYLFIVDRKKDLIISGGQNIASREVEDALLAHPAVTEAAVIGIPNEEWGEQVHAVVALAEGRGGEVERELRDFLGQRLASFKVPKSFQVVPTLPRNPVGKVLKQDLRAPYWQGRGRQV